MSTCFNRHQAHCLFAILHEIAPDLRAQRLVARQFNEAIAAAGLDYDEGARYCLSALIDGYKHGNWPWVMAYEPPFADPR
jgi:hypothetical protein